MSKTRPDWLTDDMLAEMRRLNGTSEGKVEAWSYSLTEIAHLSLMSGLGDWVDGHEGGGPYGWLTSRGHKALAAIEAEAAGKRCKYDPDSVVITWGEQEATFSASVVKLAKPCPNCDHGNGSSGLTMWGLQCSVCNGEKVV